MDGILQLQYSYPADDAMENGPPITNKLVSQRYSNDRMPQRTKMFDTVRRKIGRNSLPNRLSFFSKINIDWTNNISKDALTINRK